MLTKSLTSLALCALALTVAPPAGASAPVGAAETSATVTVTTGPVTAKPRHRRRKASPVKSRAKLAEHHAAEPVHTPQVAAAVTAPLNLSRAREKKEAPATTSTIPTRGEIMVGAKVVPPSPPKVAKVEVAPAEIEVNTPGSRASIKGADTKVDVKVVPGPATAKVGEATRTSAVDTSPRAKVALDVRTTESKVVAASTGRGAPEGTLHAKVAVTKPLCLHEGVEFVRGQEAETFPLTRCDGSIAPLALEKLSILARPESAPLPRSVNELAKAKGPEIATGIRRVDPGLVERVQAIVDHFAKAGPLKVSVVSGYRPLSSGSYHATAQALDLHVEGVRNEAVVDFCKTLADTGCGYYPNSSFIHVDVRQRGTGHVAWIDASGPGEAPHYVSSWPPAPEPDVKVASKTENVVDRLDPELPPLPADEHPSAPRDAAAVIAVPLDTAK